MGRYFPSSQNAAFFNAANTATELQDKTKAFEGTVIHEAAHAFLGSRVTDYINQIKPPFWKDLNTESKDPKAECPVTDYGRKEAKEDLSEAVKFYFLEPSTLNNKCPLRFKWVQAAIKSWNLPTPPPMPTP
jgi:hypothetical protein